MWTIIAGMLTSIVTTATSVGAALITSLGALFGSWRIILYAMLISLITIELYNLVKNIMSECLGWLVAQLSTVSAPDGTPGTAYEIVGLAAYLANHLKIIACLSFIFSTIMIKWAVVKIPFLKW